MTGRSSDSKESSSFEHCYLSSNKDEIDLIELVSIISKSCKLVFFITLLFIFMGAGITLLIPKNWVSSAIIYPSSDIQFRPLQAANNSLLQLNVVDNISKDDVFDQLIRNLSNHALLRSYLNANNTNADGDLLITKIVTDKTDKIDKIDKKITALNGNGDGFILSYNSTNGSNVKNSLTGYINYINNQVNENINRKINLIVETAKKTAAEEYQLSFQMALNEQKVRIQRLEHAVSIAKAAGLKKPTHDVFETSNNSNAYPISLGYDALNRQLEIEKSITDPTTINLELLNQKLYLDRIMALQPISVEIQSFNYSQSPSDPVVKNANKNILVIILFGFVGFVGSIGFVIIRHYVRERSNMLSSMPKD